VSGLRPEVAGALRDDVERRWRQVRENAALRGCEGVLVVGRADRPGDLLYLAGHRPGMAGHVTRGRLRGRGYGALWMPLEGAPVLMVTTPFYEGAWVELVRIGTDIPALIGQTLRDHGAERSVVGLVGEDVLSVLLFRELRQHLPAVKWMICDDLVMGLRARKSAYEIECLRRGSRMADRVGDRLRAHLHPGLREVDITAFITRELLREGAEAARATCQSGVERSGEPLAYPVASDRALRVGDMVHMEINGQADGYLIDICRSTVVGRAAPDQRRLLQVCLEMLEASVEATRPGIPAASLSRLAGAIAAREGLEKHFTVDFDGPGTYLGHGIGVANDEPPVLGLGDETPLQPGMLLTIEPGLYRTPVGGCRIEDEVLVTETGAEVLTQLTRVWWT
jgi:Xaa-Pro aminopeptidase